MKDNTQLTLNETRKIEAPCDSRYGTIKTQLNGLWRHVTPTFCHPSSDWRRLCMIVIFLSRLLHANIYIKTNLVFPV